MIKIDTELKSLIPPLSDDERTTLAESIKSEGIREPIVTTMDGTIVDGHNRYEIAIDCGFIESDIPYEKRHFENRSETMLWMIDNQRGRRNLSRQAWLDLGFKRAELLKPRAEANQSHGQTAPGRTLSQESDKALEPVDTLQEAATYAGVSRDTAAKYKRVMADATEEVKEKVRTGDTSINRAYQEIKKPKQEKEVLYEYAEAEDVEAEPTEEQQKREGYKVALKIIDEIKRRTIDSSELEKKTAIEQILEWVKGEIDGTV